jgi:acyl-CoA synthetase (NDP forming)
LLAKARRANKKARIEGVLVCEMVSGGVEMLIGVAHDELFGPVVTVGLGGIFTEVFGDVTFRVPPFDANEARRALRELKGYKLLEGVRDTKAADIDALVETVMNIQRLAMDLAGDIRELDINPLIVRPRGAVALDALVVKT